MQLKKGEISMSSFTQFNLKPEIMKGIEDLYFIKPTPIQEKTIPIALQGKDLIGQAQTGTGKTAAFVIPMLQKINPNKNHIQGLIMTPTRELAIQITEDVEDLAKYLDVNVVCLHGGRDIQAQMNKLKGKVHIVVGTPGRILDHIGRETLHFGRIEMLVLDEADKMLEMGFQEDVEAIIATTSPKKQSLLFSATMPDRVKQLSHRFMFQPPHLRVEMKQATSETTKQYYYVINQSEKIEALLHLLPELNPYLCIIFVNTQNRVEQITEKLQEEGLEAKALHGGLSQNKREQLMEGFRQIKFQYLVCTDIAARGLDVEGVTHVINYDLPSDTESYIHRVGRTGRAGQEGVAITFVSPRQKTIMSKIERAIRQKIEQKIMTHEKEFGIFTSTPKEQKETEGKANAKKKTFRRSPQAQDVAKQTDKKKVKPGYKKKIEMEKKKEVQRAKRKKVQQAVNENIRKKRRQEGAQAKRNSSSR